MLTWLGAACLAATVPLSGVVVDAQGQPAAGAWVWLADTHAENKGPETLAKTETDDQGRFRLDRPDDLKGRGTSWSPTLWAYKPGAHVALLEFKQGLPGADEPVRLELGPPASFSVRVLAADGSPSVETRVRPSWINAATFRAPRPPKELFEHLTVTTDADGVAKLDGFDATELYALNITAKGELVQTLPYTAETKTVALRPLGRLAVRIVGGDRDAPLQGWTITVNTRPNRPDYSGPFAHWLRGTTDERGQKTFDPMAEGRVYWTVEPPKGSNYIVARLPVAVLRKGETTEAEILVLRGVRVEGVVRLAPEGKPIPGVKVMVNSYADAVKPNPLVEADAEGRFSIVLPPGTGRLSYSTFDIPNDYRLPTNVQTWIDFELKEGEEVHKLDPPALEKAVRVAGRVVDENDQPVTGAEITGTWNAPNPQFSGGGATRSTAKSEADGRFELGRVAPGVELQIWATLGWTHDADPVIVPKAGEGEPVTIRLKRKPTRGVSGRVLNADGEPLAGALVRIRVRRVGAPAFGGASSFGFRGGETIRTDAEGRFQTPDQIPTDLDCQIEASAEGWVVGHSNWLSPTELEAPDTRLRRAIVDRQLTGRVVDSFGNPIAGVKVFQAERDPEWRRSQTDADGRFTLPGVPNAPALVFATKDEYRFLGRRVEPAEKSVELVLRGFAEPPAAPLRLAPSPISREEERAIARALIDSAPRTDNADRRPGANPLDEAEAGIDPDRVIALIENQARLPFAGLLEALALGRSEGDPRAMLEILDAIDDPDTASTVALGLFDRLGSLARPEFRRELLERAERRSRELEAPNSPAPQLIKIGERWLDLGDAPRGASLIREAQKIIEQPAQAPRPGFGQPTFSRNDLIAALARVDLPEALKLWEAAPDAHPGANWYRIEIAKRIAATDLDEARKLLDGLKDERPWSGRRAIRLELAKTNLDGARTLGTAFEDPITDALLPAMAAKGKAATDPAAARDLLRESVDRLAGLEPSNPPGEVSPAVLLARLLPLAARVDPDRAPDYLWLALAKRPPAPGPLPSGAPASLTPPAPQIYLDLAELAAVVARYNRPAAEVVFAPVADRLGNMTEGEAWGLGDEGVAAIAAAAIYNARAVKAIIDAFPEDPPPPEPGQPGIHRRDKARSRAVAARMLGLPPALRLRTSFLPNRPANDWAAAIEE